MNRNNSLNLLYYPFRVRLLRGLELAHAAGLKAYLFEGTRIGGRQQWLYSQGRSRPGMVVTLARGGMSYHEYGVAGDVVFDGSEKRGVQWSWEGDYIGSKKDDYNRLGPIMESVGLEWLGRSTKFREMPHFQLKGLPPITELKAMAEVKGLLAVWDYLDKTFGG